MSSMINLASDNVTGCCPEIAQALSDAAQGAAMPYGADPWTEKAVGALRDTLAAPDATVFPVATGTAANALALAALCPPWGAVLCHKDSHVNVDECGAPEMYTGGAKLIACDGAHGKLTVDILNDAIAHAGARDVHRVQAAVVSITQSTEAGTLYRPDEIRAISEVCRAHGLRLHMDGARFANAVAALDVAPADLTWKAGVDVVSFGASKNGAWAAEAVVFFDPADAKGVAYRRKRGGHLLSKGRFLGAQLAAYLDGGLWLRNARQANAMAARLSQGLAALPGVEVVHPTEANEVFIALPPAVRAGLRDKGVLFAPWPDDGPDCVRFVCAFSTTEAEVDAVVDTAAALV